MFNSDYEINGGEKELKSRRNRSFSNYIKLIVINIKINNKNKFNKKMIKINM